MSIKLSELQELQGIATLALLGSVASGKTSLTKLLTKKNTQKHSTELVNGCTIKMGYENLKIYYNGHNFITNPKKIPDGYRLIRHFSIADNPGHNSFMATLVTGLNDIDCALFLISGSNGIEPQTLQHMKCFKSTEIKNMAMVISKMDLVPTKSKLENVIDAIDQMMESEKLLDEIDPPIIPVSVNTELNVQYLLKYLVSQEYPKNVIDLSKKDFKMTTIRTFDINRPGTSIDDLKGAVFGGSIQSGYLAIGDVISILPGIIRYDSVSNKKVYMPLITQVLALQSDTSPLSIALPGGFIGIETTIDANYSKADKMVGNMIIKINTLEDIKTKCHIVDEITVSNMMNLADTSIIIGNQYFIVTHAFGQMATLNNIDGEQYTFCLSQPTVIFSDDKVAILAKQGTTLDMLAYGTITQSICSENIVCEFANDAQYFLDNLPIKDRIESINIINDLETIPAFNNFHEELHNMDSLTKDIEFQRKTFNLNCQPVEISKNTTSFTITNAKLLMSDFTDDIEIISKLIKQFSEHIKNHYATELKNASVNPTGEQITFNNVRGTGRKYSVKDMNDLFVKFIIKNFTCSSCNTLGSVRMEKNKTYCKFCNALLATKKIREL